MWLTWIAVALAGAPCPSTPAALVAVAEEVERAWTEADGPAFEAASARLDVEVGCVDAVVGADEAAVVHRARALAAFVQGDVEASRRAFVAVRLLAPGWRPPDAVVPEGHPLRKVFDAAAPPEAPRTVELRTLPEHGWVVDGARYPLPREALAGRAPAYGLPADRAFVLQLLGPDGAPSYTGYHLSTTTIPASELALAASPSEIRARRRKQARLWGSVVGGALLAGGGVTFGLGWSQREALVAGQVPLDDVEATAATANTLGGVSYGLAGAGALLTTLAWSVPW